VLSFNARGVLSSALGIIHGGRPRVLRLLHQVGDGVGSGVRLPAQSSDSAVVALPILVLDQLEAPPLQAPSLGPALSMRTVA